jgi:hypothetical protein
MMWVHTTPGFVNYKKGALQLLAHGLLWQGLRDTKRKAIQ